MVLRLIEQKIEALVEGVFGRAFRTNVQPVELARKLAKEMDDHRQVSVSRVYVPNEYTIFLSESDRAQFEGYEESLVGELQEYLAEHARRETYALLSPPKVLVKTDEDLDVGEFGIAVRMAQPAPGEPPRRTVRAGSTGRVGRDDDLQAVRTPRDAGRDAGRARARARSRRPRRQRRAARAQQAAHGDRPLEGLRPPARRRERVAPARRGAPGGNVLLDHRPRLDERRSR